MDLILPIVVLIVIALVVFVGYAQRIGKRTLYDKSDADPQLIASAAASAFDGRWVPTSGPGVVNMRRKAIREKGRSVVSVGIEPAADGATSSASGCPGVPRWSRWATLWSSREFKKRCSPLWRPSPVRSAREVWKRGCKDGCSRPERRREERDREIQAHIECVAWCNQALAEFPSAVRMLDTSLLGISPRVNPPWPVTSREEDGKEWAQIWPILLDNSSDNSTINALFSAAITPGGQYFFRNKPASPDVIARHIAYVVGDDIDRAHDIFRRALLGRPMSG